MISKEKISNFEKKLAERWLRTGFAEKAMVAELVGVSESMVYKWASGQKPIPTERAERIIWAHKKLKSNLDRLDSETDLYFAEKYSQELEREAA